jgi:hypothetical protein
LSRVAYQTLTILRILISRGSLAQTLRQANLEELGEMELDRLSYIVGFYHRHGRLPDAASLR